VDVMYWDNHHYNNMKAISKQPTLRALIPNKYFQDNDLAQCSGWNIDCDAY